MDSRYLNAVPGANSLGQSLFRRIAAPSFTRRVDAALCTPSTVEGLWPFINRTFLTFHLTSITSFVQPFGPWRRAVKSNVGWCTSFPDSVTDAMVTILTGVPNLPHLIGLAFHDGSFSTSMVSQTPGGSSFIMYSTESIIHPQYPIQPHRKELNHMAARRSN